MREILLTVLLVTLSCLSVKAQTVGYTYRPFASEGCHVEYSVFKQDTVYYIVVLVSSDRLKFRKESTMKLKTFEGDVIKLNGALVGNDNKTGGLIFNNIIIPVAEISTMAQFCISQPQFELLSNGVAKVRLSTMPIEHERIFKKDKIGKKLCQLFLEQKNKDDCF